MDIQTIFGITWRKASIEDVALTVFIFAVPVVILVVITVVKKIRYRRIHDSQLFLFKLKRLGLSNFQIKIINNVIGILSFSNPNRLLENPEFFEEAVARFLDHVRESGEDGDSQSMMCRDITVIYDKLYFNMLFKSPLKGVRDLDENQLVYCMPAPGRVLLGKIVSWNGHNLYMKVFGGQSRLAGLGLNRPVPFHIFRMGDAEYEFTSMITGKEGPLLLVEIPRELTRKDESRHPYVEVILPALLSTASTDFSVEGESAGEAPTEEDRGGPDEGEEAEESDRIETVEERFPCTIYKINNYEAVLRIHIRLDFNHRYYLDFTVLDFNLRILARVITTKTVEEGDASYYTVKFDSMSESANNVLKKYVYEHL